MKRENFNKRLILNKETISRLNENQLNLAKGGATWSSAFCAAVAVEVSKWAVGRIIETVKENCQSKTFANECNTNHCTGWVCNN